ncbi:hypothetical protein ACQPZ2_30885 [Nocardia pseudovaccinii]|uniref:hypothetical protein n=1 Tax=Nocardia pseudovaccinii TaxID=189540 RepID=UPI003D907C15
MSPREELLSTGRLGPAGAQLLYTTVKSVALSRNFPPPPGSSTWDQTAVTETAHDFVEGDRGAKRLLELSLRSMDDPSFARLLEAAVVNFFRDIARRTDLGKLIIRVKELLRDERDFEAVPGSADRWTLPGGPVGASTVPISDIESAITAVTVVVPKWSSERRDAPVADRPSMVRLILAVLAAADGSLTATEIAHVLTARLDHRRTPLTISLDVREQVSEPAHTGSDPATQTIADLHAAEIFQTLGDRERIIVTKLDVSVRDLGQMIDTGKTQAGLLRQRLIDRLRGELADDDQPDRTASALCKLCEDWVADRTKLTDATSYSRALKERGDHA